ncbi:MAG: hypothetical protein R2744_04365 [Bacteroidales bacterium]
MNLPKAEEMIVRCLKSERNNTYLDTYAWVLYKQGKYRKAGEIMKEILRKRKMTRNCSNIMEIYGRHSDFTVQSCCLLMYAVMKPRNSLRRRLNYAGEKCITGALIFGTMLSSCSATRRVRRAWIQ